MKDKFGCWIISEGFCNKFSEVRDSEGLLYTVLGSAHRLYGFADADFVFGVDWSINDKNITVFKGRKI